MTTSTLPSFDLRYGEALAVRLQCFDAAGDPYDLTGASVRMILDKRGGGGHVVKTADVVDASGGLADVDFDAADYGSGVDEIQVGRHDFAVWSDDTVLLVGVVDVVRVPRD